MAKDQAKAPRMLFGNKVVVFFSKPANVILVVFFVLLCMLTLYPLLTLVSETFTVHAGRESIATGQKRGTLSLYSFKKLLFTLDDGGEQGYKSSTSWIQFYSPLFNTLSVSLLSSFLAILFGGVVAWLVTRTNIRFKKFISAVFVFPYIMPSWTLAMFWSNFFKNVNVGPGTSNGIMAAVFGIMMPEWFVYGFFPISMVLGLHYAPFAYILIGGILRNMDANLEEAASILKTPRWRIVSRITLPIVMPAMLSTLLLVFASTMSAYAVPVFLGSPVRYYVLSTKMMSLMSTYKGQGYIIASVMIIFGVVILAINQSFTGKRKSFTTVTGKSSQISLVNLKKANWPIALILMIVLVLLAILPLVSFALESVIIKAGDYSLSNMTLDFWIGRNLDYLDQGDANGILFSPKVLKALGNSLLLGISCAVIAGTCGVLVGYGIVKRRGTWLSGAVNNLSFFPYLLPSLAFGAIYLAMSGKLPFINGMFALILIGSVKYLPFASRSGINAMLQLSNEIEEAAVIVNVPWWKRMTRIIFPIQKSSFLSGYLLPFVSCMRELSLFTLLVPTSDTLLTTMLMQYSEKGWDQFGNAINLLIIIVVLIINFAVNKLTGASIDKGIGA
ncbi:MAG: iron ABC transporter permease [Sphaerochaetaceae bacterium]|nr:iron ABC transporter permease [Sphaerochaetaceae bacterium]MDD3163257.1 iron ABC transporter permease [Sphaerochaetaceae bacterium]MDD4007396.1 iron ABC transporter permease [Sphaerochaetaceae bacterium]MDD4396171.1 iron ABC transporter permease [Sphaerochaetaceae bacterium]